MDTPVRRAVARARDNLLGLQREDGHWCGLLEGDSILESEYVLLLHFLGRGDDPRATRAGRRLRDLQLADGGWAMFPGGPPEVSASIKGYLALKLLGEDPGAPHMARTRSVIRRLGGIPAANTYTQLYLALLGQWDWDRCPALPPEMLLLPSWFPFQVDRMSSWSRAIFVPLSILWALRPDTGVARADWLAELRDGGASPGASSADADAADGDDAAVDRDAQSGWVARGWRAFFRTADWVLRAAERLGVRPFRQRGLKAAESWILERLDKTDGLGAVFPSVVNAIMAFRALGYPDDHPALVSQLEALEKLEVDRGDRLQIQPSLSPVWDTAQSVAALQAADLAPDHPALVRAGRWLLQREVLEPGDWRYGNPDGPVGGWYFEYANEFYPDCDDTAEVLVALRSLADADIPDAPAIRAARERGLAWLLSMQNEDGGWGAFDRGCDYRPLVHVPFADHNAMLDPSCADITGRVVEMLIGEGVPATDERIRRAVAFILDRQDDDGTWYGRWGNNRLYGSWLAVTGLLAAGEDPASAPIRRYVRWLEARQNDDGGWGETPASYWDAGLRGVGPSTAAQTAWALLTLHAAGERGSATVAAGIGYLLRTQKEDGSWQDESWTATGFPKVFFLQYHLYDDYFPLLALSRWGSAEPQEAHR